MPSLLAAVNGRVLAMVARQLGLPVGATDILHGREKRQAEDPSPDRSAGSRGAAAMLPWLRQRNARIAAARQEMGLSLALQT